MNCWQSLPCSPDRCVFRPSWAFSPASQRFCSWNTQVRMPSAHRGLYLILSAVSYPSLGSSIRAEKPRSVCLRTPAWKFFLGFFFFHTDTAHLPFKTPHTKSYLSHLSLTWPSTWLSVLETSVPCSCPYMADPEGDGYGILIICIAADAFPESCKGRAFMP